MILYVDNLSAIKLIKKIKRISSEEKQINNNYEIVILLATFNKKVTNKISVNFKFYNNIIYIMNLHNFIIIICKN